MTTMQKIKSEGPRVLIALVLVTGLSLLVHGLLRQDQESQSAADQDSSTTKSSRMKPTQGTEREGESAEKKNLYSVDDLVAIYEKHGMTAALAAAKGIAGPKRDSQVLFILNYLAKIDPEFVAGELKDAGLSPIHQGFVIGNVMREWKDGASALAWGDSFTGKLRKDAVAQALGILVKTNPAAALAHLENMPDSGSRSQAQNNLFVAWGTHDPQAALKFLAGDYPAEEKAAAVSHVLNGWARNHPAEAAAWAMTIEDEAIQARAVQSLVHSWNNKSPEDAQAWVDALPEGPVKERGLKSLKEVSMRITKVCGFGEEHVVDVSWKEKKVSEMEIMDFGNWATQDPAGARKHIENSTGGEELSTLAAIVTSRVFTDEGPQAAFDWAQGLAGEAGITAQQITVISWSNKEPAEVAKQIESLNPSARPELSSTLARQWVNQDPAAAASWVASYQGAEQKDLVKEVLQQWINLEPVEAYTWLGTLPNGESRDQGIDLMFRREMNNDPQALVPWVALISDPKLRTNHQRRLERELADDQEE